MKRREFISFLGGAAAWPLAARAQPASMLVIGLLQSGPPSSRDLTGFRQGLKDTGYVEGQNLKVESQWANDDPDRLPELAADLVRRRVRVIVSLGSNVAARAAKAATDAIPIVFGFGIDPVQQGLVASLNRPSGNVIYLGDFDLSGGLTENNSVARPGCNSSHSLGSRRESCSAQQLPPIVSSGPLDAAVQELRRRHGEHEANTGSQKTGARAVVAEQHVPYAERQKVKQISPIGPLPQIRQRSPSQYP